jgi:tungstate transport system ATP-binding protein
MARFADDGLTIIFSTHNLGQVKRLAERVIYLEDGCVVYDGSVERFFAGALPAGAEAFIRAEWPGDQRWGKG